jgi:hypothetical protein
MNNFKDYGFEADFKGEILRKTKHDIYIGYVVDGADADYAIEWNSKGDNLLSSRFYRNFNLKPIKKEWYENPDNFPCIVISLKTNKAYIAYNYNHLEEKIKQETFSAKPDKFRPATEEEVLALLVKE